MCSSTVRSSKDSGRAARPGDDAAAAAQQQDGAADGCRQDDAGHMRLKHEQDNHRDEGQRGTMSSRTMR